MPAAAAASPTHIVCFLPERMVGAQHNHLTSQSRERSRIGIEQPAFVGNAGVPAKGRRVAVFPAQFLQVPMSLEIMSATPSSPGPALAAPDPSVGTVLIALPGLRNAAPVGGGCCAVDAVVEELESWPGIMAQKIDRSCKSVSVRVGPSRVRAGFPAQADAVRDLGSPEAGIASRSWPGLGGTRPVRHGHQAHPLDLPP